MLRRSEWERRRGAPNPFGVVAARRRYLALAQRLSWRGLAVSQNFSNRRRKILNAGTWHNDAVTAAMSFFGDAQESPAVVLPELHVEMLALDLQFSRLDDVIHFYLRPPTLPHPVWGMEAKSAGFRQFLLCEEKQEDRPKASLQAIGRDADATGCDTGCSLYNLVRPAT